MRRDHLRPADNAEAVLFAEICHFLKRILNGAVAVYRHGHDGRIVAADILHAAIHGSRDAAAVNRKADENQHIRVKAHVEIEHGDVRRLGL